LSALSDGTVTYEQTYEYDAEGNRRGAHNTIFAGEKADTVLTPDRTLKRQARYRKDRPFIFGLLHKQKTSSHENAYPSVFFPMYVDGYRHGLRPSGGIG
jgi:hypothetical protein